jgi:hypothetical protein
LFDPPFFNVAGMPEQERVSTWHLWDLLDDLNAFSADFEAGVRLLEHCRSLHFTALENDSTDERLKFRWLFIPARDAALSLYHFGWVLTTSIPQALGRCPTVRGKLDPDAVKAIRREFQDRFPDYHSLRHAIGHAAELTQSRDSINKNAAKGGSNGSGFMRCNMRDNRLIYTINGKEVSVAISRTNADALWDFTRRTIAEFTATVPSAPAGA